MIFTVNQTVLLHTLSSTHLSTYPLEIAIGPVHIGLAVLLNAITTRVDE